MSLLHPSDIESQLTSGQKNGFVARFRVGSNELEQLVYMDTGLWINCELCGYNVPGPIFDPKESSSYEVEDCNYMNICDASGAVKIQCDGDYDATGCAYDVRYGRLSFSRGRLARETFKFGRSSESLENIVFGCARSTNLYMNGVLGLGRLRLSFISQLQMERFSYCIGNISDRSYPYNTLVLGDKIELLGNQTPLIIEDKYYITLEGIKIGEYSLDFDPQIFKRISSDYRGGMVIDTVSTLTFIPQVVLSSFEDAVIELIEYVLDLGIGRNYSITHLEYIRLCYNGVVNRDLTTFPTVKLKFQGDAIMELTAENIFQQSSDQSFCLAILPSEILETSISILGNLMQQYFYVAYDLKGMKLSFHRMDCNAVDNYIHDEL